MVTLDESTLGNRLLEIAFSLSASNLPIPIQRRHRILHRLRVAGSPVVVVFRLNRLPCGAGESQGARDQLGGG